MHTKFQSDRTFKVWEFQVSHGQLLIRSPKAPASRDKPEQTTNLDIIFLLVDYLAVPKILEGIELVAANQSELNALACLMGKIPSSNSVCIIESGGRRFPIVAANVTIKENTWDIFESPLEMRSHYRAS